MAISQQVKEEFRQVITEELGLPISQDVSDKILRDLVGYYRTLADIQLKIEGPQSPHQ
jgi:hypothetical protein